ncbi:probable mitochondrial import inner membrane translocase subunit TIM21 [Primulina eburnea]|uniref:probable mitochondrial import inner membrane translocase subunit TIM21 n=1 Tax=Primulina eburnea TaxID=1245227 RepID=UPI003C6BDC05
MINLFKRSGFSIKNKCLNIAGSPFIGLERTPSKSVPNMGFAEFSFFSAERSEIGDFSKRVTRRVGDQCIQRKDHRTRRHAMIYQSSFQCAMSNRENTGTSCLVRCLSSGATESTGKKESETQKNVSTIEDPFDAPTYNIPEKPVTFTEGASYSLVILAGLGIAGAAAYGVFKELIFEPKEYEIFGKALERIQNDSQVRVRIGSPVTGYGSESRNRAARQRIPHNKWTDEDGVEHIVVNFHIRGPHGAGKVYTEMFKDKVDKQWKFMYLIVEVTSPSPAQLMLESYVPA